MMRALFLMSGVALAALVEISSAHAEEACAPLHLAMATTFESNAAGRPIVTVKINGSPRHFLFDTGGFLTQISPELVKDMDLPSVDSPLRMLDINGNAAHRLVTIADLSLGKLQMQQLRLPMAASSLNGLDGLLTPSLLHMDVDVDFGTGRFAYFLQDHCPGKVVYWNPDSVTVIPINQMDRHLRLPVVIDGHTLHAEIDTGSDGTYMDADVAHEIFGLTPADGPASSGINGDASMPAYKHSFASLSFGDVTVSNVEIGLMRGRWGARDRRNKPAIGNLVRMDDDNPDRSTVIIGMNILKRLHIYMALRENRVYISPASKADAPNPFAGLSTAVQASEGLEAAAGM